MLYIGNHTSSSRGYLAMGKQMLANGGNTFAFFTRNPRGGKALHYELLRCQRKPQGFCQRNHGR